MQISAINVHERPSFANTSLNINSPEALSLKQTSFAGIISQCHEMQKVFNIVEKVAKTASTVLVLGESGTGKELIAKAIHKLSGRAGKLVPVNCGAIPEDILESELFGHEKGSFTGAISSRMGRFQMADGGTVFLDEIGEMSPKLQVKLLRFLQERKIEPVGSAKSIDLDVRVVAATNKDLKEEVKQGRFREDLFYRLQVVPIELPPLRTRRSDIGLLADYFMQRYCTGLRRPPMVFSPQAQIRMQTYNWPGNVRELENLVERLSVLCDGDILQLEDLPDHVHSDTSGLQGLGNVTEIPAGGLDFNQLVDQFESKLISMALTKTNGNKKAAAKLLSLNRTTLVEKIKKKELENRSGCDCSEDPEGDACLDQ